MKIKFTDSFIKSLKATGKPYSHGDTEHKGLLVRVSATGTKTFALAYHSKAVQKTRFLTFGQFGDTSLAGAFAAHAKARAALANGEDPQVEERASKKSGLSYAGLVDLFVAGKLARQRPCMTTLRLHRTGRRFGWADREVEAITEDEATACLIKLAEKAYTNERGKPVGGRVEAFATKSLLGEM